MKPPRGAVTAYRVGDVLLALGPLVLATIWLFGRGLATELLAAGYVLCVLAYPVYR